MSGVGVKRRRAAEAGGAPKGGRRGVPPSSSRPAPASRAAAPSRAAGRLAGGGRDEEIVFGGSSDEDGYDGYDDEREAAGTAGDEARTGAGERVDAESADEKRLRLARSILAKYSMDAGAGAEGEEDGSEGSDEEAGRRVSTMARTASAVAVKEVVAARLRADAMAAQGTLFRPLGAALALRVRAAQASGEEEQSVFGEHNVTFRRAHKLPVTCVAVSRDGSRVYAGSKDCTLSAWDASAFVALGARNDALEALREEVEAGSRKLSHAPGRRSAAGVPLPVVYYPGAPRTKAHSAAQERAAAKTRDAMAAGSSPAPGVFTGLRSVQGTGVGGGRVGSTTPHALAGLSGAAATSSLALTDAKIVHADGMSSIILPAASLAKQGAGVEEAREKKADLFRKLRTVPDYGIAGHYDEVLAIALSSDGRYLASAGRDNFVRMWDPSLPVPYNVDNFVGHKDVIAALAFRAGSHALYSASFDRTVKVWNCDEMAYSETLFGHQAEIYAIAALARDRCVTAGRDRSVRVWKIPERSQLVFRAHATDMSTDAVAMLNDNWSVSGGADGSLSLWHSTKKKPIVCLPAAHGDGARAPLEAGSVVAAHSERLRPVDEPADSERRAGVPSTSIVSVCASTGIASDGVSLSAGYCAGITALAACPNSDLFASGSGDGFIRLWRVSSLPAYAPLSEHERLVMHGVEAQRPGAFASIRAVAAIPVRGIVNGLAFSADGSVLVAAVGTEPRLGRWWHYAHARNGLLFVRMPRYVEPDGADV